MTAILNNGFFFHFKFDRIIFCLYLEKDIELYEKYLSIYFPIPNDEESHKDKETTEDVNLKESLRTEKKELEQEDGENDVETKNNLNQVKRSNSTKSNDDDEHKVNADDSKNESKPEENEGNTETPIMSQVKQSDSNDSKEKDESAVSSKLEIKSKELPAYDKQETEATNTKN